MAPLIRRRNLILTSLVGLVAPLRGLAASSSDAKPGARVLNFQRLFTPDARLPGPRGMPYLKQTEEALAGTWAGVHEGKGTLAVTSFRFDKAANPASFVSYDIPPGGSEGVHTHQLDDPVEGSFDEFYYIVSGQGQMRIGDETVPVKPGDHVFTPIGVPHGIENVASAEHLKVLITYIYR